MYSRAVMSLDVVRKNLQTRLSALRRVRGIKLRDHSPRISAPCDRQHIVVVTCVDSVKVERSKLASEVRGSLPDLDLRTMSRGDEPEGDEQRVSYEPRLRCCRDNCSLSVRRELDVSHWLLEVEVVKDGGALEVDEHSTSVCTSRDPAVRQYI